MNVTPSPVTELSNKILKKKKKKNNGDCVDEVKSYTCECDPGWNGTHYEITLAVVYFIGLFYDYNHERVGFHPC